MTSLVWKTLFLSTLSYQQLQQDLTLVYFLAQGDFGVIVIQLHLVFSNEKQNHSYEKQEWR